MVVKKVARPINLPGVHPGLMEKIREAEKAELEGRMPRSVEGPQKVVRPPIDAPTPRRKQMVRTIGLIPGAHLGDVDPRDDIADIPGYLPGVELDEVWDTLSENQKIRAGSVERFRLEMDSALRRASMSWEPPHKIGGRLDARNLARIVANLSAEIDAYGYLLAKDSRALLDRFVISTTELFRLCLRMNVLSGIDGPPTYEILRDWVQKLIYQELNSRRRAMGDRGIRRIWANIELADMVYSRLKGKRDFTPKQQLLMRLIHVHQDVGHTAYAARTSYRGSKLHRAYGARIFNDELNRYRPLFTHKELELCRFAVATHSSEEFVFGASRVLALVRAVDHLAPFAPHRVYLHLEPITEAHPFLDAMVAAVQAKDWERFLSAKAGLAEQLEELDMEAALRDDIMASFRAFERLADPIDLGETAGAIRDLQYDINEDPGFLTATITPHPWTRRYQVLFDYQQDQLMRLARVTKVKPEALHAGEPVAMRAEGHGALQLRPLKG